MMIASQNDALPRARARERPRNRPKSTERANLTTPAGIRFHCSEGYAGAVAGSPAKTRGASLPAMIVGRPSVPSFCSTGTVPTCAHHLPSRAAAVKDGPSSGHRFSGAQRP